MPNNFAYFALIAWPFISLLLYKRMPIVQATFWTIIGGFLLLPAKTEIDFPFIPALDKESIPILAAMIGCRYIKKVNIRLLPENSLEKWLVLIFLFVPIITTLNNQEAYGLIRGLTLHDTISAIISQYIFILPLILGMQIIKTYEDQLLLFKLLVIAGLFYSIPILFEVRMSPQLHTWIYGFFPHSFGQQIRFDGFRSVVFLGHGLLVAMFVAVSLGAASIIAKQKIKIKILPPWFVIAYFIILLFLSKTVGAFILGMTLYLLISFASINVVKKTTIAIMFIVIMYPVLSLLEVFPHQTLVQAASNFDAARGKSLDFRFAQESQLLEHAKQKLYFGWGGWGRNRLDNSTTDGYWIIALGQYGLFGFISIFGLSILSIWNAIKYGRLLDKNNFKKNLIVYHALLVSIIMIDQLPNASFSAWLLFIIGSLHSRLSFIKKNSNLNGKPNVY